MGYSSAERRVIRKTILGMSGPFALVDLYYILEQGYTISNRTLICNVLDELCDSGVVEFFEVNSSRWAYRVKKVG